MSVRLEPAENMGPFETLSYGCTLVLIPRGVIDYGRDYTYL
jgi:hypothetical protein